MNSKTLVVYSPNAKAVAVPASEAVPQDLRMTFDHIADDPTLPYIERRKLLKIKVKGMCVLLKDGLDSKIRVEQGRLAKSESVALTAISAYGDRLIYQIRNEFTKTLRKWGLRVNIEQLRLLTDFGEQLTQFKSELNTRGLDPKYKKYILKAADGAFDSVSEQLGNLAGRIFDAAHKPQEDEANA